MSHGNDADPYCKHCIAWQSGARCAAILSPNAGHGERRTRRVAQGCSVLAGPLSHHSTNSPMPLSSLEEAILIVSTGLTGVVMHDGPLKKTSGAPEDLGSMFWNIFARSGPSADNCQATSLFMINDDGIWLLRRLRGKTAAQVMDSLPRSWSAGPRKTGYPRPKRSR